MIQRRYLLFATLALIVVLAIPLPSYLRTTKINRRMAQALSFPSDGYVSQHPALTAEARIFLIPDEHHALRLLIDVVVTNVGGGTLVDVMAAAKVHPEIASYTAQGWITVQMFEPVTLQPGLIPPSGVGFSRSTPLRPLNEAELSSLNDILREPVRIKLVHDDGVELIYVRPTMTVR
jgi:hypothetical protein